MEKGVRLATREEIEKFSSAKAKVDAVEQSIAERKREQVRLAEDISDAEYMLERVQSRFEAVKNEIGGEVVSEKIAGPEVEVDVEILDKNDQPTGKTRKVKKPGPIRTQFIVRGQSVGVKPKK